jgi:ribonuclease P protein component
METLKTRAEFQRVRNGRRCVTPAFILQGCARESGSIRGPRFGFAISSKSVARDEGGTKRRGLAVDRNRAKRRLKEAVRLTFVHARQDFDYVIIGRAAALTRNFARLLADMEHAFHKVGEAVHPDRDCQPFQ